jgi:hypothetical protein
MSRMWGRNTFLTIFVLLLSSSVYSYAGDAAVQVQLDSTKAGPRAVESLTEQGIIRDYRLAWTNMSRALEFDNLDPLNGSFVGEARQWLRRTITNQTPGLSQKYVEQNHKLEAVFYAPEGDAIELHDTAQYRLQLFDGGKLVDDEPMVVHYVVLMTPSADRWMVRQLQAVPEF